MKIKYENAFTFFLLGQYIPRPWEIGGGGGIKIDW